MFLVFCGRRTLILLIVTVVLAVLGIAIALKGTRVGKEDSVVLAYEHNVANLSDTEITELANKFILPELQSHVRKGQVEFSWKRVDGGIEVMAHGNATVIKRLRKADRVMRTQLPAILRLQGIAQRQESSSKLEELGRMLREYRNNNNGRLPTSLDQLERYDVDNLREWVSKNVEYLGKGESLNSMRDPLAYDKTLLAKGHGTNVLFGEGIVNFTRPEELENLGIISSNP